MKVARHKNSRYWAVKEEDGTLLCVCVYRRGAVNLVRRMRRLLSPDAEDASQRARRSGWRSHVHPWRRL